jgi:hypothetical protein
MSDELGQRAVACKGWQWLPGMRAEGRRGMSGAWFRVEEGLPRLTGEWSEAVPDLTDPATLGCLLALVREAWGRPGVVCTCLPSDAFGWLCCGEYGPTEAEALVAALESAP